MAREGVERFVRLLATDEAFALGADKDFDAAMVGFDLTDDEKEFLAGRSETGMPGFGPEGETVAVAPVVRAATKAARSKKVRDVAKSIAKDVVKYVAVDTAVDKVAGAASVSAADDLDFDED